MANPTNNDMTQGAQSLSAGFLTSEGAARQNAALKDNLATIPWNIATHDTGGSINFTTRDGYGDEGLMGQPTELITQDYVQALEDGLDATFNEHTWKEVMAGAGIRMEQRPPRTAPTPIVINQMNSKIVHFDPSKRFIDAASAPAGSIGSGTLKAGQQITMDAPVSKGFSFHSSTYLNDFNVSTGGFTKSTLIADLANACRDMNESLCTGIVATIDGSESLKTIKVPALAGSTLSARGDEILDLILEHISATGFSDQMEDAAIVIPLNLYSALERLAQKLGYGAGEQAVERLVGGTVMTYKVPVASKNTGKIYILPKMLVAVSFRSQPANPEDIFKVETTRDPNRQGWVIEVRGEVDILCNAWTEVVQDIDGNLVNVPAMVRHMVCLDIADATLAVLTDGGKVQFSKTAKGSFSDTIPAASLKAGSEVSYFVKVSGATPTDDGSYSYSFALKGETDGDGGNTAGIGGLSIKADGNLARVTGSVPVDQVGKKVTITATVTDAKGTDKTSTALVGTWVA